MKNMFINYDNPTQQKCNCASMDGLTSTSSPSFITNIKNEIKGIKIKHLNPFTLYIHLENKGDLTTEMFLDALCNSFLNVELLNLNNKIIFTKKFVTVDILNKTTLDLKLIFNEVDVLNLNKETYKFSAKLYWEDKSYYELFDDLDGLLVIR